MIGHIIESYINGEPFNRKSASPMECIALCFARAVAVGTAAPQFGK